MAKEDKASQENSQDRDVGYVVLVNGNDNDGHRFWVYASIDPSHYDVFLKAQKNDEEYDLSSFGKILAWGKGDVPPDDVRVKMEKEYGYKEGTQKTLQRIRNDFMPL